MVFIRFRRQNPAVDLIRALHSIFISDGNWNIRFVSVKKLLISKLTKNKKHIYFTIKNVFIENTE